MKLIIMIMVMNAHNDKIINFMEESIYNIIPKDEEFSPKKPIYRSKYPHNIPPTSSTFGNHTTSRPIVSNLSGDFYIGFQPHTSKGATQTFGHLKGDRKLSPQNFQKKRTGTMGNSSLPPVRNFSYDGTYKKEPVPKATQRPAYGLQSNKNFILSNAVENILSSAKKKEKQFDWTKKKDYGQNPQYLEKIKRTLHDQYKMIQTLHSEQEEKKKFLTQEEISELKQGLRSKWDALNKEYQKFAHIRIFDTHGIKSKKARLQAEMTQIQQDIKKLNKPFVLVED